MDDLLGAVRPAEGEHVAGVDEVGRGPLAGPVFAAAVVLHPERPIAGLRDSKALTATQREELAARIRERAFAWALGRAEVQEIDRINILRASLVAMRRAVDALAADVRLVYVDGNIAPAPCLPDGCGRRRRRQGAGDQRRVNRRQGGAGCRNAHRQPALPRLRLRAAQGLRHPFALGGAAPPWAVSSAPPLLRTGARRTGQRREVIGGAWVSSKDATYAPVNA